MIAVQASGAERPAEPRAPGKVWYRGWEAGYDFDAAAWTGRGYRAYKGGCDLDALCVDAPTWAELMDEIDEQEDE